MRKGLLIYEENTKIFTIYGEVVSHITDLVPDLSEFSNI
jgi:hypothetical protein